MQRNIVNDGEEGEKENETLKDEIIAINSIYGEDTIRPMIIENDNNDKNIYILHLPHEEIWLKIQFAPTYPYCSNINNDDVDEKQQQQQKENEQKKNDEKSVSLLTALPPIRVLGTHGCGPMVRKGDATRVCHAFEQFARQLFRPGDVYLFDIIEELMNKGVSNKDNDENSNNDNNHMTLLQSHTTENNELLPPSDNETEKKKKSPLSNLLSEKENVNSILTSTASTAVVSLGMENVNYKKAKEKSKKEDDSFYSFTHHHHHHQQQQYQKNLLQTPTWFISEPIRELKSLFLAHCTHIYSINDVSRFRNLLLDQEDGSSLSPSPQKIKKLTSATHNIMAWRIRYSTCTNHNNNNTDNDNDKDDVNKMDTNVNFLAHPRLHNKPDNKKLNNNKPLPSTQKKNKNIINNGNNNNNNNNNGNTFTSKKNSSSPYRIEEDYDDDGESAAGARLLHLLRLMDICNVLVIVSRWYGGVHLGPRRFALINSVARDAILKATTTSSYPDL